MDAWMHVWKDGWMDEWLDAWMHGCRECEGYRERERERKRLWGLSHWIGELARLVRKMSNGELGTTTDSGNIRPG